MIAIPKNDLTGKTFGELEVLEYAPTPRATVWKCRCRCGKETLVHSSNLLAGKTKSCGCRNRRNHEAFRFGRGSQVLKPGDVFGKLTLVEEVAPVMHRGYPRRQALCRCACGNERIVLIEKLRSGNTKSCGCLKQANHRAFCIEWKKLTRRTTKRHEAGQDQGPGHETHATEARQAARANRQARATLDAETNCNGAQAEEARSA